MQGQTTETTVRTLPVGALGPSPAVVAKLETTRREMYTFQRTRCLLGTALLVLALAGLLAGLDWLLVLPAGVRAAGLLLIALAAAVQLWRGLVAPRSRFGAEDAAAEVESAFPDLGQRVRTTVEYTAPRPDTMPAEPGMVRALVADTDQRTSPLDFHRLIPWRSLWRAGLGVAALAAVLVTLLVLNGELRTAALRLGLAPINYTNLHVKPGDQRVKVGSDLAVQATLTGRPVRSAELQYRPAGSSGDWTRVDLAPPDLAGKKLSGTLETTLKDCRDDLEYRVVASTVESPVYRLSILRPLVLKQTKATVHPPAYTRRPEAVMKEGNFKVIAGSKVRLQFTLDRAPKTARLEVRGNKEKVTAVPLQVQGKELVGELPAVDKELEYQVVAEAADGMKLDDNRFRILIQPDRKPTVRFVKPKEQIEVTPTTEVHMKLEATDDFGLSVVGVVFQVGNGEKKTLYLNRDPAQPTTLKTEVVLPLEDQEVTFQDGVSYYAFAEDNHPDQPQRVTSELQWIDIRPYKREFQILDGGGS
jgi:hypothetical protein